jgi:Gti1/Pac2 family
MIPRVTRRLVDSERKMITSGSVFVFDEDESGIKRWTDGFFWSPSRILGNFLLYRETEKRGAGHRGARNDADQVDQAGGADGAKSEGQTLSRPRGETTRLGIDRQRERSLVGSLTNSYKFKAGGMMKKVRLAFCMKSLLDTVRFLGVGWPRAARYHCAIIPRRRGVAFPTPLPHSPLEHAKRHESRPQDVRSPSV